MISLAPTLESISSIVNPLSAMTSSPGSSRSKMPRLLCDLFVGDWTSLKLGYESHCITWSYSNQTFKCYSALVAGEEWSVRDVGLSQRIYVQSKMTRRFGQNKLYFFGMDKHICVLDIQMGTEPNTNVWPHLPRKCQRLLVLLVQQLPNRNTWTVHLWAGSSVQG